MSGPPDYSTPQARPPGSWFVPAVLLALVFCALAIRSESYWMDEAGTATIALQPTPAAWWQAMLQDGGSSTQMPLYMVYLWGWEKIFGHGEWWLRAANLPWLALGLLAIPRRQPAFLLVIALSPFLWFYLNEARPYVMQISLGLLLLGALWRLAGRPEPQHQPAPGDNLWTWGFGLGLVALAGSSLLGMIWAGAALATALPVLGWSRTFQLVRRQLLLLVLATLSFLALAGYYLWSLKHGARATPGSTGVGSTLFCGYELLGFAGLGPGRNQIRAGGPALLLPYAPLLAIQAVVVTAVLLAAGKHLVQNAPRRVWLGVTVILGAAVVFLLAAGGLKHFRVLGRHFAPLAPVVLLLLAIGWHHLWSRAGWRRGLAVLFLISSLVSCLSLRLAQRHAKDDYRTAAAMAIAANARGERVWWCANEVPGLYYGVPLSALNRVAAPGQVWLVANSTGQLLTNQPPPDLVILSKPDLHDYQGFVRAFLQQNHYQPTQELPAFTLWRKN
ncbi:MAG: hypothetical protein ACLQAH_14550 [Limisphaerales bacterium]